jgi:hypothetical protein
MEEEAEASFNPAPGTAGRDLVPLAAAAAIGFQTRGMGTEAGMSMKALNHLLGRSAIDPSVKQAFEEGRILGLLTEYEFAPALWEELSSLEADDFPEYAMLAYRAVRDFERSQEQDGVPSPLAGLTARLSPPGAREEAA